MAILKCEQHQASTDIGADIESKLDSLLTVMRLAAMGDSTSRMNVLEVSLSLDGSENAKDTLLTALKLGLFDHMWQR